MISGHLGRSQIDCVEKQTKCSIGSEDISLFVEIIADLHQKKRFTMDCGATHYHFNNYFPLFSCNGKMFLILIIVTVE